MNKPIGGSPGYQRDLAEIHHLHYDNVARSAAEELVERLHRQGITEGLVVDLGCGSGVTASLLVDAGFDVLGVDISADMIRLARKTAPDAEFVCASLFDVDIPECVAVIAISEAVNYAFDKQPTSTVIASLLDRIHQALVPEGLMMLDVTTTERIKPNEVKELRANGEDYVVLVRAECSADGRRLVRDITLFRRSKGDLWRRADERHEQRLFDLGSITESLLNAGFRVDVLSGYSGYVFPAGWNGFVGRPAS